ncbi:MAG: hypothetical protein L6Q71_00690 [Planctomycetes bacterium]|nr:hypothetical protein [Planctomycetota bacterium]
MRHIIFWCLGVVASVTNDVAQAPNAALPDTTTVLCCHIGIEPECITRCAQCIVHLKVLEVEKTDVEAWGIRKAKELVDPLGDPEPVRDWRYFDWAICEPVEVLCGVLIPGNDGKYRVSAPCSAIDARSSADIQYAKDDEFVLIADGPIAHETHGYVYNGQDFNACPKGKPSEQIRKLAEKRQKEIKGAIDGRGEGAVHAGTRTVVHLKVIAIDPIENVIYESNNTPDAQKKTEKAPPEGSEDVEHDRQFLWAICEVEETIEGKFEASNDGQYRIKVPSQISIKDPAKRLKKSDDFVLVAFGSINHVRHGAVYAFALEEYRHLLYAGKPTEQLRSFIRSCNENNLPEENEPDNNDDSKNTDADNTTTQDNANQD